MKTQHSSSPMPCRALILRRLCLLVACAVFVLASKPAVPDTAENCMHEKEAEAQIRACSEYIERAQGLPEQQLALAYYYRGEAYVRNEQYDHGRSDLDQAIRMNPNLYLAYVSRGLLERFRKQYDDSLEDFNRALAIIEPYSSDPKNTATIRWLKETVKATGYYKEREERWVEYLKEIQDDRDCQNWSALPYDLYRSSALRQNRPLPANAEGLSVATLQPCEETPEQITQTPALQASDQTAPSTSSHHRPILPVVLLGFIVIVVLFALLLFSSR